MGARSNLKRIRKRFEEFVKTLPTPAGRLEATNELVAMGIVRKKNVVAILADDVAAGVEQARLQLAGEVNAQRRELVRQK